MKHLLVEEYEYDFNLLGVCCHEKDYRLCWAINSSLDLNLSKSAEDIELIFNKKSKPNASFPIFSYVNDINSNEYYLIGNKCERSWLIPEKSHIDFFLLVKSDEKKNLRLLFKETKKNSIYINSTFCSSRSIKI